MFQKYRSKENGILLTVNGKTLRLLSNFQTGWPNDSETQLYDVYVWVCVCVCVWLVSWYLYRYQMDT